MRLEALNVHKLEVLAGTAPKPGEESEPRIETAFAFKKHRARRAYKVALRLRASWPKDARFKRAVVHLEAVFSLPADMPDAEVAKYYPMVCAYQMVGFARSAISGATAMSPGGPYTLPFLDVTEAIRTALSPASEG